MQFTPLEQIPDQPEDLPPARRRHARRLLVPLDADERAVFLARMVQGVTPSFDFFSLSLLSGAIFGFGLFMESPPMLVLGAALVPCMAPLIGIGLGATVGAPHLFLRSLGALLTACGFVFIAAFVVGKFTNPVPSALWLAPLHTRLSPLNFLVLGLGAVLTTAARSRAASQGNPLAEALPNVVLTYEIYLPLATAAFGLGASLPHLWPDGLVVFLLHLAWGALLSAFTLAFLGLRPLTLFGYTLGATLALFSVIVLLGLSSLSAVLKANLGLPTPTPTLTPTLTVTPRYPTSTAPHAYLHAHPHLNLYLDADPDSHPHTHPGFRHGAHRSRGRGASTRRAESQRRDGRLSVQRPMGGSAP